MNSENLSPETFQRFCDYVYEKAGIRLGPQKEALVSARMGKRMRSLGLSRYEDYLRTVKEDTTGDELVEMLNAISTNLTYFFREGQHFKIMESLLRQWSSEGQTRFRIWCAASSTGEEPYTIAMTARAVLGESCDVKILATDISTRALAVARRGQYEPRHMEKVPETFARRFFRKEKDASGNDCYKVVDELRRMISFARLNLAHPPYPMKGPFDIVFCRNVMIYFDNAVRKGLLDEAWRLLKPGGYLMVGHAESLSGMLCELRSVQPSVYIK
ncbi:MAG TPA: chemotaxis protein CheR [Verrucomicrobia bacterium]|nr:chemotaxis protein CheR [Verrucomicrobiota bacterium]